MYQEDLSRAQAGRHATSSRLVTWSGIMTEFVLLIWKLQRKIHFLSDGGW